MKKCFVKNVPPQRGRLDGVQSICHSGHDSESIKKQTLKRVQGDKNIQPLRRGEVAVVNELCEIYNGGRGCQPVRDKKFDFCRPLSPTSSPAGRGEKKAGFTLAEILITLGVIGVVAAMTIPNLISNYQKKQYYAGFMKARTLIENAVRSYEDEGLPPCDNIVGMGCFIEYLPNVLKGEMISNSNALENYKLKFLNGDETGYEEEYNPDFHRIFVTVDGIMYWYSSSDDLIYVDINGINNKPNTFGRDVFQFEISNNPFHVIWSSKNYNNCNVKSDGTSCASKLIEEGKMNY
ncbi:type II secretion system protein [bacterium]|nr:type II secretion system protein [bacterium]